MTGLERDDDSTRVAQDAHTRHQPWDRLSLALARRDSLRQAMGAVLPGPVVRRLVWAFFAAKHPEYPLRYRRHERDRAVTLLTADRLRCIFVHIPKTAGVSVAQGLFGDHGGSHLTIADYRRLYAPKEFARAFKFTVVREPSSRLYSAWRFVTTDRRWPENRAWAEIHLGGYDCFRDFVLRWLSRDARWEYVLFQPQVAFVLDPDGSCPLDFVGNFESLNEDFATICRRLGVDRHLPHANRSAPRPPDPALDDPKVRERIADVYREDYERFYPP